MCEVSPIHRPLANNANMDLPAIPVNDNSMDFSVLVE
jgi:hypothetical protein